MDNILSTDEYKEVDGRQYLNPQVALDESNTFIDNLRSTQDQQNQEIFTDTQMLGTDVPSVEGGLTGGNSYFTSRYQTPQTNAAVANLRATAQAQALNQALQNEQEIWKKKYQDAYRNYQKRQYDRANSGGGGNSGGGSDGTKGDVGEGTTDFTGQGTLILDSPDDFVPEGSRIVDPETGRIISDPGALVVDPVSGNIIGEGYKGDNPRYIRNKDGSYTKVNSSSNTRQQNSAPLADALRSRF